jgi:hypothetical protein
MPTQTDDKQSFRGSLSYANPKRTAAAKSATYTMVPEDGGLLLVDGSGGSFTVTLPPVSRDPDGVLIEIKCSANPGANTVTIAAAGSDTIDGAATSTLLTGAAKKCLRLHSDGVSKWYIVGIF